MEVKVIGTLESRFESTSRIYDVGGCSPTLSTMQGGNQEPKILEVRQVGFMDNGTGKHQSNTVYDENALCPNITTVNGGGTQQIKILTESSVLTPKRTEYGKAIRKAYESGAVQESRHNMTELEPRKDGISNTLATVQKDNLVLQQLIIQKPRGFNKGGAFEDIAPPITSNAWQENNLLKLEYRIRKLTPRECGRLMSVRDSDISKMESANSNTQMYKQFGNSIVVQVMVAMFSNLNIQGLPDWDTIKENY